jgi:DNA polymerase-1
MPVSYLHKQECKACPLNSGKGCKNPKLTPLGTDVPDIYMLAPAPTAQADRTGKAWAGYDKKFIDRILDTCNEVKVRWSSVVRTHTGEGTPVEDKNGGEYDTIRSPNYIEIECCRPSIVRDIEETQPKAIFGFGGVPLKWAANETHAYMWQGRRIPVKIGNHTCWYYPFVMPHDVLKDKRWDGHVPDSEHNFAQLMRRAVKQVLQDDPPVIWDKERIYKGVEIVTSEGGDADLHRIGKFLDKAANSPTAGLDYETNALRPYRDTSFILTGSVSIKGHTLAFPFQHRGAKWTPGQLDRLEDMFREFLYAPKVIKIAHQLPFELEWSAFFYGEDVVYAGKWGDSLSQAYIIDETQGLLSLEALTVQYFGFNIKELSNVDRKNLDNTPLKTVLTYNGLDSKFHRELYLKQKPILEREGLLDVYDHQVRRIPALVLTTMQGVPIDQKELRKFRDKYETEMSEAMATLADLKVIKDYNRANKEPFRPSATPDIVKLLKQLNIRTARSAKGNDTADEMFLKKIKHPVIAPILKYKKAAKVLSTYVDAVTPGSEHLYDDGKARPIISTTKVRTWRTSSEDPNMQNWPSRGDNVVVRRVVSGGPKYKVVAFDYAGIQGRNVAMESKDKRLVKAFIDWYDIHTEWMETIYKAYPKWFKEGYDTIMKDPKLQKGYRHQAKNKFVFPTFFGAQGKSIGANLGIPPEVVQNELHPEFFGKFPDIKKWQDRINKDYHKKGYVTGLSGFRRHAPIGFNEIINAPIQADEAIIVLESHIALSRLDYKRFQPMMEIHDDLTFLFPVNKVDEYSEVVVREMTKHRFDWINVPLVVEMSVGDNWADKKHVADFESVGTDGFREVKNKG